MEQVPDVGGGVFLPLLLNINLSQQEHGKLSFIDPFTHPSALILESRDDTRAAFSAPVHLVLTQQWGGGYFLGLNPNAAHSAAEKQTLQSNTPKKNSYFSHYGYNRLISPGPSSLR